MILYIWRLLRAFCNTKPDMAMRNICYCKNESVTSCIECRHSHMTSHVTQQTAVRFTKQGPKQGQKIRCKISSSHVTQQTAVRLTTHGPNIRWKISSSHVTQQTAVRFTKQGPNIWWKIA